MSAMFRFTLHDVDEIDPWGGPTTASLSWFGLSLGVYSISCGGREVLRYSPDAVRHWLSNFPEARYQGDEVEYQVARLHEDLLEALPDILSAVPAHIAPVFRDGGAIELWRRAAMRWDEVPDDHVSLTHLRALVDALNSRRLDTAYLSPAPLVLLWRDRDLIHLDWSGRCQTVADGVPAWKQPEGHVSLSVDEFLSEVRNFHTAFVSQMAIRIQQARENWTRPAVAIDFEELKRNQRLHEEMLDDVLTRTPTIVDWAMVERGEQLCSRQ